jgi:hypothetical protein
MYMSEIIMMAEDINADWYRLPLNQLPALNIFWEYGVCYPLVRYFMPNLPKEDPMHEVAENFATSHHAVVFLHPTRFSMMLWIVKDQQHDTLDDNWVPCMVRTPCLVNTCIHLLSLTRVRVYRNSATSFHYCLVYPQHPLQHHLGEGAKTV